MFGIDESSADAVAFDVVDDRTRIERRVVRRRPEHRDVDGVVGMFDLAEDRVEQLEFPDGEATPCRPLLGGCCQLRGPGDGADGVTGFGAQLDGVARGDQPKSSDPPAASGGAVVLRSTAYRSPGATATIRSGDRNAAWCQRTWVGIDTHPAAAAVLV